MSQPRIAGFEFEQLRETLYSAVVCDALDALGWHNQAPRIELRVCTVPRVLIGRAKTTLWGDLAHIDEHPYEKELLAVDSCQSGDVLVCAAAGSMRSGIWGELLSTAARNAGCVGAVVDGAVRDVSRMREMSFPVFARGTSVYDSRNRQRVVDYDVPVELGGVRVEPGDLVIADTDGLVVVPRRVEAEAIQAAWKKVHDENETRAAIQRGMKATEAYARYGTL